MGTSRSFAELGRKVATAGRQLDRVQRDAVGKSALLVKTSVQSQLVAAGVTNGRLRGVGTRGARIGVGYNLRGTTNPSAVVRMRGPAHLIESDTRAHVIKPKRKKAVMTPYGPRARVRHPGTKGKRPWKKGVAAALPKTRAVFLDSITSNLARVFR